MNNMKFESTVNVLNKYSKIIKNLSYIKGLDVKEVESEAWLLLAEFDASIVVTDQLFEKKLLQKVTDLTKSCGLGRGSKGGCVNSNTDKERNNIEVGYAESAEDALELKLDMLQREVDLDAAIAELPSRTQALILALETSLTGREIMSKYGDQLGVSCLSVMNRRLASESKRACEPTTQIDLF